MRHSIPSGAHHYCHLARVSATRHGHAAQHDFRRQSLLPSSDRSRRACHAAQYSFRQDSYRLRASITTVIQAHHTSGTSYKGVAHHTSSDQCGLWPKVNETCKITERGKLNDILFDTVERSERDHCEEVRSPWRGQPTLQHRLL